MLGYFLTRTKSETHILRYKDEHTRKPNHKVLGTSPLSVVTQTLDNFTE